MPNTNLFLVTNVFLKYLERFRFRWIYSTESSVRKSGSAINVHDDMTTWLDHQHGCLVEPRWEQRAPKIVKFTSKMQTNQDENYQAPLVGHWSLKWYNLNRVLFGIPRDYRVRITDWSLKSALTTTWLEKSWSFGVFGELFSSGKDSKGIPFVLLKVRNTAWSSSLLRVSLS